MSYKKTRIGDFAFYIAVAILTGFFSAYQSWSSLVVVIPVGLGVVLALLLNKKYVIQLLAITTLTYFFSIFYYHFYFYWFSYHVYAIPVALSVPIHYFSIGNAWLLSIIDKRFNLYFSSEKASLLLGLLTGSFRMMSPALKHAMTLSGTSYIITMYGYKMSILSISVFAVARKIIHRFWAFVITVVVIIVFVVFASGSLSAFRAACMAMVGLLAKYSGNTFNPRNALTFTALLLVLFDPMLVGEAGFQLSFLSTWGVFYLGPIIRSHFWSAGFLDWKEHAIMAVASNIPIIPIVMTLDGQFSWTSFISNIFIVIPLALILLLGTALALMSGISYYVGILCAYIVGALLEYELVVIKFFADFFIPIPAVFSSSIMIVAFYASMLVFVLYYEKAPRNS